MTTCFIYIAIFFFAAQNIPSIDSSQIDYEQDFLKQYFPLPNSENEEAPQAYTVVRVFYDSMCPESRHFMTKYFSKIVEKLGEHILYRIYAYGKTKLTAYYNGTIIFRCHNGETECYGNKVHLWSKYSLPREQYVPLISCLMDFDRAGNGSDDAALDECGTKLGISESRIEEIKYDARNRGTEVLLQAASQCLRIRPPYTSGPYVEINNKHWIGKPEDLFKVVCAAINVPPKACKE